MDDNLIDYSVPRKDTETAKDDEARAANAMHLAPSLPQSATPSLSLSNREAMINDASIDSAVRTESLRMDADLKRPGNVSIGVFFCGAITVHGRGNEIGVLIRGLTPLSLPPPVSFATYLVPPHLKEDQSRGR